MALKPKDQSLGSGGNHLIFGALTYKILQEYYFCLRAATSTQRDPSMCNNC